MANRIAPAADRPRRVAARRRRYRSPPGQRRSERDVLDPGACVVTARLDDRGVCRVGTDPAARALVERGNGVGTVPAGRP